MSCTPTPWRDWLCELGQEGRHVPEQSVPLAFRGFDWVLPVAVKGDYTDHQLIGRVGTAPDESAILAAMTAFGPVLHEGRTLWEMSLTAEQIDAMPSDPGGNAVAKFLFFLVLVPPEPAAPHPLAGGPFSLLGAI